MISNELLRPYLREVEKAEDDAKCAKAEEMARNVREATCAQLVQQIQGDIAQLRERLPDRHSAAMETAKDVKYVRERQQ